MIIGTAPYAYRWVDQPLALPPGIDLGDCHGLAVDRRDHVFLLHQNGNDQQPAVLEFDAEGAFVRGWGNDYAFGGHGLLLVNQGGEEHLLVVDYARARTVVRHALDGRELSRLARPVHAAYPVPERYMPTDVAAAPDGSLYVTDGYQQHLIHRYDPTGVHVQTIGWRGTADGQFECPHGVFVDARGAEPVLLVADRGNIRVQVLGLDGRHRQTIISRGLRYPCTVRAAGELTLIPDLFGRLILWDRNYRLVATLGDHPEMRPGEWPKHVAGYPTVPVEDRIPGRFIAPHCAAADSRGRIYVGEWIRTGGRVTRLDPVG